VTLVDDERERRLEVWAEVRALGDAGDLDAAAVNALRRDGLRVFFGGRGIWTDKARTADLDVEGVTVGLLHTGRSYADDLLPDGIVYHYPRTTVSGRDAQEIAATKAANELGLPLFVVVQLGSGSRRAVHLGWVEDWDDKAELFLVTFGESKPSTSPTLAEEDELPFELERPSGATKKKVLATARPGQHRFSFRVFRRYGARCAVCDVSVIGLLDAAHLRPYQENGSDDVRNGLVFCATHHRAFDKRLFGIDPVSLEVSCHADGPTRTDLGINVLSIKHLPDLPHTSALEWCWTRFASLT